MKYVIKDKLLNEIEEYALDNIEICTDDNYGEKVIDLKCFLNYLDKLKEAQE